MNFQAQEQDPILKITNFIVECSNYMRLNFKEDKIEYFIVKSLEIFWAVIVPIMSYLGYYGYKSITSNRLYWLFIILGSLLTYFNSVPLELYFSEDPSGRFLIDKRSGRKLLKSSTLVSREAMRQLGAGLIFYAIGGFIGKVWKIQEFICFLIALPPALKVIFNGFSPQKNNILPNDRISDLLYNEAVILRTISSSITKTEKAYVFCETTGQRSLVLPCYQEWSRYSRLTPNASFILRNNHAKVIITHQKKNAGGYTPSGNADLISLSINYIDSLGMVRVYSRELLSTPSFVAINKLPAIETAYHKKDFSVYSKKVILFSPYSDEWTFTIHNYNEFQLCDFHEMLKSIQLYSSMSNINDNVTFTRMIDINL